MSDEADDALLRAVAAGDPHALHALYQRHGLALLNALLRLLHDRAQAEDVLQAVMLAVWRGAGAFRGDSSARTWLYAIARRQAFRALRRDESALPLDDDTLDTLPDDVPDEPDDALQTAIARLPGDQQAALELVYYRGLALVEAAARLNVPLNTLKSRLHRAREALRRILTEEAHD